MRDTATLLVSLLLCLFPALAAARPVQEAPLYSDDEIQKLLVDRIDVKHQSVGMVVGIVEPEGRRVVAYGHLEKDDTRPLDGNTIFEIGSETKVFTGLLLADMVQRGEVKLNDPVAKYLPATVKLPEHNGKKISLLDLATHTSGLPQLTANQFPKDPTNPYADYSVEQMYQFLATYELTRDPGSEYEYSNLGDGLLGHVLELRSGMTYEKLVESRICTPLEMWSTKVTITPDMKARLAAGHNAALETITNGEVAALAGSGALRSTADDMLSFLAAYLGYVKSPLSPAMAAALKARRSTGHRDLDVALGWHILSSHGREIVWHNGGSGGYQSYMGFDAKGKVGVVILSNASAGAAVNELGRRLIEPGSPPPKDRKPMVRVW